VTIPRPSPGGRERAARDLAFTSYLRILAIVAVVGIHTLTAIVGNDEIRGSATWILGTALNRSLSWAVPMFVMVSGALLLAPVEDESPTSFYRRRLRRIAIPLVVANIGYLLLRWSLGETLTVNGVVSDLLTAKVYTHLYFFWIILGLYLVTPLLRPFIATRGRRDVLALGIGALAFTLLVTMSSRLLGLTGVALSPWQPPILTIWIPYVGYFVLGYALRELVTGRRGVILAILAFVAGNALTAWEYMAVSGNPLASTLLGGGYLGLPTAVATIGLFVLARTFLPPQSWLAAPALAGHGRALGNLTLGVFVIHLAVLKEFWMHVPPFAFHRDAASLPRSLELWALVVVVSFGLSALIGRIPVVRRTIGL
jgi:surface polysaccharide O-acyltransferase-like enzyme